MRALYGENKQITDGKYDKSLAVKCVNGTFVGRQPVGGLRLEAPVDVVPDEGIYEAYYNAKSPCQEDYDQIWCIAPPLCRLTDNQIKVGGKSSNYHCL